MIPKQLTLQNFLSYMEVTLDFGGLHVACVCGPNGAGKSSLLEAMGWAVWGESRVALEDDVVHLAATEAMVDFVFEHHHQTYRVIRRRQRGQGSFLDFQVLADKVFRSLTQNSIRATQALILQHLKIDYETFVNSAYLRQGRADEFMLKRPAERKQLLADLLKLSQYDDLADKAKEKARDLKAQVGLLEANLEHLKVQLVGRSALAAEHIHLGSTLEAGLVAHQVQLAELEALKQQQRQRLAEQQQLTIATQQLNHHQQIVRQLEQALGQNQQQYEDLQTTLQQAETIQAGYRRWQVLQVEEEQANLKAQAYQLAQQKRTGLQQRVNQDLANLQDRQRQVQLRLANLHEQGQDLALMLNQRADLEAMLAELLSAKSELQHQDRLQMEATPLQQQLQTVKTQLYREEALLSARLQELSNTQQQLEVKQTEQPQLMQAVLEVSHRLEYLEQRRAYQAQVQQKGQERRNFMERLQADQRNYEVQLAQIDQKIQLLCEPHALCPLCQQPLKEHNDRILKHHQQEREEIQSQIWVIREQLLVSEREIKVLRREYREIDEELYKYADVLQQQGHLQAQISSTQTASEQLQRLNQERAQLEACLQENRYAETLQAEMRLIGQQLLDLNYDERTHALVRNQVEKLRWVESKMAELSQAERRLKHLQQQTPPIEAQLQVLEAQIADFHGNHPLAQELQTLDQHLVQLGYDFDAHLVLREQLRAEHGWQLRYQALQQAQAQLPALQARIEQDQAALGQHQHEVAQIGQHRETLSAQLAQYGDCQGQIEHLSQGLQAGQTQRDGQLAQLGRLDQQLTHLDQLQTQLEQQQQTLQALKRQYQVYQALAQAYGKNGIQALMIENLLPQLEAMTNQLLGRLSAHQLHVQFLTQRMGRNRHKPIDTLDILIADPQGTRPYETYSGGEAFRVNFAIRLALARLLAQRSGMALQMLIIDEGFGSQDKEGCDRLIAAINAISSDFACILSVTHMPHFREAFQTRIDIIKTVQGSQISISG
jgi:DNA repair protein SbcC/Rad50